MLMIAILDDKLEEALETKKLLLPYLEKRDIEYDRIDIYQNGASLLHSEKQYDMLFLDIEVGEENGIEIAKKLRKKAADMIIIVVTSFIKYSMEGYKIQAARYLLKPVAPSLLYSELDEVLEDQLDKPTIILHDHSEETKVKVKDIYFFESYGRKVQFHTRAQAYLSRESVSYWSDKLHDHFIECYKGIYVHVKYIDSIHKDVIVLDNEQTLPLARRRVEEVRREWIAYQEMLL